MFSLRLEENNDLFTYGDCYPHGKAPEGMETYWYCGYTHANNRVQGDLGYKCAQVKKKWKRKNINSLNWFSFATKSLSKFHPGMQLSVHH